MDLDDLRTFDERRRPGRGLLRALRAQPRGVQVGAVVVGAALVLVGLLDGSPPPMAPAEVGGLARAVPATTTATTTAAATTAATTVVGMAPASTVPPTDQPVASTTTAPAQLPATLADLAAPAVAYALEQVGKPYRFAAAGPDAFDCSGLTRASYLRAGIDLPHHAAWQADAGSPVQWHAEPVAAGDLIFTRGGRPEHDLGHVGLAVSATQWVVAPAPGRLVALAPIPFDLVQRVRRLGG